MTTDKKTALQSIRDKTINKKNLGQDTRGLSTVEYLILLVVIAVAGISVWGRFAGKVENVTNTTGDTLESM
jgi:Flp pilus assembly pilin Flp